MIWEIMRSRKEALPRAQRVVAEYMLNNRSESLFMTSQQLGAKSGTSEATVIRLAAALGFSGFPDFKEALQEEAKDQLSTLGRLRKHRLKMITGNLLSNVISNEIDRVTERLGGSDDGEIRALAAAICESGAVYLIGLRSARSLAIYLQYYLSWFFPNIYVPENDYLESYLVSAPANSLIVGISFPRYTRLTVGCVRQAREMGLRTASITDSHASPLAEIADISVTAPCAHVAYIDSLMIPLGMANAILLEVTNQLGQAALDRLRELETVWASGSIYC